MASWKKRAKKWLGRRAHNTWKRIKNLRFHEWVVGGLAITIVILGALAWYYGTDRTIATAIGVAEPVFVGLGALSIVLLWAQLRDASIWNRLLSYHQFFDEIPKIERSRELAHALRVRMRLRESPGAYNPLTQDQARAIFDEQSEDGQPSVRATVPAVLNAYEYFCGAINEGLVDEDYARELRGSLVIDAYFGYRELINIIRDRQEERAKTRDASRSAEPFKSKHYLELQNTATRWHKRRCEELKEHDDAVAEADARTKEELRRLTQGVAGKARNRPPD